MRDRRRAPGPEYNIREQVGFLTGGIVRELLSAAEQV
jgi:hypothetical protein